jgi:hypothetical protein
MLYGNPSPAAHRATADGGLALLVKSAGTVGQHRQPASAAGTHVRPRPQRRVRREPQRTGQYVARGLAAVIVLGLVAMIGFLIVAEGRPGPRAEASALPSMLDSRADDPVPLTLQEVFGDPRGVRAAGGTYRIAMTHIDGDCLIATTGALGQVLREHGCSQVVRAALTAPYGGYEVTAGVVNLTDAAAAADVDGRLRWLVETGDGSFAAMATSRPGSDTASQVGWHAVGHYLLYCVITRPDGQLVTSDDPYAARITTELVDSYLGESVLSRRPSSA